MAGAAFCHQRLILHGRRYFCATRGRCCMAGAICALPGARECFCMAGDTFSLRGLVFAWQARYLRNQRRCRVATVIKKLPGIENATPAIRKHTLVSKMLPLPYENTPWYRKCYLCNACHTKHTLVSKMLPLPYENTPWYRKCHPCHSKMPLMVCTR